MSCSHEISFHGMCAECGSLVDENPSNSVRYLDGIRLSQQQMNAEKKYTEQNLLKQKKLILILDLDHTLLNSAHFKDLTAKEKRALNVPRNDVFYTPYMHMVTKIRPFVKDFLQATNELFHLHVYTMGNREYAMRMVQLIDPTGEYFKNRVISSNDSTDARAKNLDIVLGNEKQMVIVDDSPRIWVENGKNVVVIERYHYFEISRHLYGPPGPSLLLNNMDETADNSCLLRVLEVLRRIHAQFFSHVTEEEADVRNEIKIQKKQILRGVYVVFSGFFPCAELHPEIQLIWKKASALGAICEPAFSENTTHVVAYRNGTKKTYEAKKRGLYVVSATWLDMSETCWKKMPERDFELQ